MAGNENEELFETLATQAAPERIGEAVPRRRTAERRQVEWRPVSLEELVPDDHRARAVWRIVEGLPAEGGKQPYFISAASGEVLSITGLWDEWRDPETSARKRCTAIES